MYCHTHEIIWNWKNNKLLLFYYYYCDYYYYILLLVFETNLYQQTVAHNILLMSQVNLMWIGSTECTEE